MRIDRRVALFFLLLPTLLAPVACETETGPDLAATNRRFRKVPCRVHVLLIFSMRLTATSRRKALFALLLSAFCCAPLRHTYCHDLLSISILLAKCFIAQVAQWPLSRISVTITYTLIVTGVSLTDGLGRHISHTDDEQFNGLVKCAGEGIFFDERWKPKIVAIIMFAARYI